MSFLAGRLAGTEGSYFLQESKQAVTRILQNQKNSANVVKPTGNTEIPSPDVLPEVMRHSLPPKIFTSPAENPGSSFSNASKWALKSDPKTENGSGPSRDALNPLRAYVSLPPVTFGPKRWQLPDSENSVLASTANDLRHDKHAPINPEKLKAAAAGLSQIGSAFAVATAIVFGGATLIFGLAASKLELRNSLGNRDGKVDRTSVTLASVSSSDFICNGDDLGSAETDDIRNKGKDLIQPKFEMFREQLTPLRTRVEAMSKKWHLEKEESLKEKPLIKELSRTLSAKTSA